MYSLRPRQNGHHFADDIFNCIFLNENIWISIKISLKFVLKSPINNIPTLIQIMARHLPGDKPLSESMIVRLLTYCICVTLPQWGKIYWCCKTTKDKKKHIHIVIRAVCITILCICRKKLKINLMIHEKISSHLPQIPSDWNVLENHTFKIVGTSP